MLVSLWSCGSDGEEEPAPIIVEPYSLEVLHHAYTLQGTATILDEVSGIAASSIRDTILWVHNDDGAPDIHAISNTGNYLGKVQLANAENRGWEDMGAAKDPVTNKNYIYLAATGDNKSSYTSYFIHRVEEPLPSEYNNRSIEKPSETIEFTYEDITSQNVDAMSIDPKTLDVYLFSKGLNLSRVYIIRDPFNSAGPHVAERIRSLREGLVVSSDMNANRLLIKTYSEIYCYSWQDDVQTTLDTPPSSLIYLEEAQGEAVCWDISNKGYYTFGELTPDSPEPILNFYEFKN